MVEKIDYTIDLTKIDGDGAFPCPKCGTILSPDAEKEETYKITHTEVRTPSTPSEAELLTLTIQCLKCKSTIKLVGFT